MQLFLLDARTLHKCRVCRCVICLLFVYIILCRIAIDACAQSAPLDSWDYILSDQELGASIVRDLSSDYDFRKGASAFGAGTKGLISTSHHVFRQSSQPGEEGNIDINLSVYESMTLADNAMREERGAHFAPYSQQDTPSLKRYPAVPPTTEQNPFLSQSVEGPRLGDDSFIYRWGDLDPTMVFRIDNVVVTIEARQKAQDVAMQQASKVA